MVGAGPAGLACAIEVQKAGFTVKTIEQGCIVNSLYKYPTNLTFFTTPEPLEIGDIPMRAVRERLTRGEALKYYRRVTDHYRLDFRQYERVQDVAGSDGAFTVASVNGLGMQCTYSVRKAILATGF